MNTVLQYGKLAAVALLFTVLSACIIPGGGGPAYGGDYYEPAGYVYGGWSRGYQVGPPRGEVARPRPPGHPPYRPATKSRPIPSIPTRSRPAHPPGH